MCVQVLEGCNQCTVAFVLRAIEAQPSIQEHLYKFVTVVELYLDSSNTYKRDKSYKNMGVASVAFLHKNKGRAE